MSPRGLMWRELGLLCCIASAFGLVQQMEFDRHWEVLL